MRRKAAEEGFDVPRLLASQLDVITVGIKVGSQRTLEVCF
jgi:hypothetical protein